jgi:hydroxymethylpyrimidine pyrophosphatase-like HAD family hydrolase
MRKIKLVVTDVDGTLVREQMHQATPAVHQALREMQQSGVIVASATARPFEMAKELFVSLGFTGPCIFDGGATIRDVETGELLWSNWLSVERLRAIAEIMAPHADVVDVFPGFRIVKGADFKPEDITEPAPYAWCRLHRDVRPHIAQLVQQMDGVTVHLMEGEPDEPDLLDIQVTDIGSDKFHGVQALRSKLGVSLDETLAIGDGTNDVPLLKAAGIKVAMANAAPELKAVADYQVATVDEDGWAEAMRRFVLA